MTTTLIPLEKRTVFLTNGKGDLGEITSSIAASCGIENGFVKLLNGVEGATGGFGNAHIESHGSRMKQLNGLGYKSAVAYVHFVVSDFTYIAAQDDGRIVLIRKDATLYHMVICQWDTALLVWSVTTAIPKNNMRKEKDKVIWEK